MTITSRYSEIPGVTIDESNIPAGILPLLPLAREWCIIDDSELDEYIAAMPVAMRQLFCDAFEPHFETLARWHRESAQLVPQPDELVIFDIAANAAATVARTL